MTAPYTSEFYAGFLESSRRSAQVVAPLVLSWIEPKSVVDVGCGAGVWLEAFAAKGVADFLGVDGSHVKPETLRIPPTRFVAADLERPLNLGRTFDLAISVEVAEHVRPQYADVYLDSLCGLSPFILFSAAIPLQGGVHHVNENWPEYWIERFHKRGFAPVDCLRHRLWDDERVGWFYAQNALIFAREDLLKTKPGLLEARDQAPAWPRRLVHPRNYLEKIEQLQPANVPVRALLAALPGALGKAFKRRLPGG